MRRNLLVPPLFAGALLAACSSSGGRPVGGGATTTAAPSTISVRSSAFQAGGAIPRKYSCSGAQVSPPLAWSGVPAGTQRLALVVDDPDAGGFVHWVLVGIDPATTGIAEGQVPPGAVVISPYKGPCPPSGTHHYQFTLYAVPGSLQVAEGTDPRGAIGRIQGAATARGQLVGTFSAG
jgi:Raf kinase inhibitor-like YbhB/YbcL family protein